MLSKLSKVMLISAGVEGHRLSSRTRSRNHQVPQTCDSNLERLHDQFLNAMKIDELDGTFQDYMFPAGETSLYWTDFLTETDMYETYQGVAGWATPAEIGGATPSLWGTKGVLPTGVS